MEVLSRRGSEPTEGFLELAGEAFELDSMLLGQQRQVGGAFVGERDPLESVVEAVAGAGHEAGGLRSVDEPDHRVVPHFQPVGELADGRRLAGVGPADDQQELVLARGEATAAGGLLGDVQEGAQGPPEPGNRLVLGVVHRGDSKNLDADGGIGADLVSVSGPGLSLPRFLRRSATCSGYRWVSRSSQSEPEEVDARG